MESDQTYAGYLGRRCADATLGAFLLLFAKWLHIIVFVTTGNQ